MERLLVKNSKVKKGDVYGRRTVIGEPFKAKVNEKGWVRNRAFCVCRCECGRVSVESVIYVKFAKSCGCDRTALEAATTTHGMTGGPMYSVWKGIKARCYYEKFPQYKDYGGRGIVMCEEWRTDFKAFHDWGMANGWAPGLEIDRVDNDAGYSPSNCRFVPDIVNQRNKRTVRRMEAFGEVKKLHEWLEDPRCVVSESLLKSRLCRGWKLEKALLEPMHHSARWHGQAV